MTINLISACLAEHLNTSSVPLDRPMISAKGAYSKLVSPGLKKFDIMNTIDLVQQKVANLPKEVQLQVLDFVNYLTEKYSVEDDAAILEAFLLKRAKAVKKDKRVSANDLRKKVLKKYKEDSYRMKTI